MTHHLALEQDRVRANTDPEVLARIDQATRDRLLLAATQGRPWIERRLRDLEDEWDIERMLELSAASFGFLGLALGTLADRRWLLLTGVVLPFLAQHAVQGWCPPLVAMRAAGIRTRREIDAEKYALKALLGEFRGASLEEGEPTAQAERAYLVATA